MQNPPPSQNPLRPEHHRDEPECAVDTKPKAALVRVRNAIALQRPEKRVARARCRNWIAESCKGCSTRSRGHRSFAGKRYEPAAGEARDDRSVIACRDASQTRLQFRER